MQARGPILLALVCCAACGSHGGALEGNKASTHAPGNGNEVAAVASATPQALISASNDVLRTPRVHLIAFGDDANTQALEDTLEALVSSSVWAIQTAEYGVGALTLMPSVQSSMVWAAQVTSGLPTASPNADIEAYILSQIGGSSPPLGSVDANDLIVLAMPSTSAVSPNVTPAVACDNNVMAWHSAVSLPPSGLGIPYVVVPSCGGHSGLSSVQSQSVALVQALVAAATNPRQGGFGALSPSFAGWYLAAEAPEAPALCAAAMALHPNFILEVDDMPYPVARSWSNAAYKAGALPCVPGDANMAYLTATPQPNASVAVTLAGGSVPNMLGVLLAAGSSTQVQIELGDVGAQIGPFNLTATELGTSDLTLNLSQSTGTGDERVTLDVGMSAQPQSAQHVVQLSSSAGGATFSQYLLVRQSAS